MMSEKSQKPGAKKAASRSLKEKRAEKKAKVMETEVKARKR
jgi:hypothetical protein